MIKVFIIISVAFICIFNLQHNPGLSLVKLESKGMASYKISDLLLLIVSVYLYSYVAIASYIVNNDHVS